MLIDERTSEKFAKYMKKYKGLYRNLAIIAQKNLVCSNRNPLIVDIGIGPGLLSIEINKLIPNAKIIGIDPSFEMLKLAKKELDGSNFKKIETILTKAESIPLKNDIADLVISRFSFIYWDDPSRGLTDIYRILKPGGRMILELINKDYPRWKLFLTKIHMFINSAGNEIIKYHINSYKKAYTMDQIEKLISKNGFKIILKEGRKSKWKLLLVTEKPLT
jgi:demethylmenaquinone methyltransferase/2-methoxy-6-polyprenyl-1,4-benzoquinol methylase